MDISDLTMKVDTGIRLKDVILSKENEAKIKSIIGEVRNAETFKKYGLTPTNKVIMYGASGTGKTYLTKALCNHIAYRMVYVDISSLAGGEVVQNIKEVFNATNEIGHCVVFFDECDSIAWSRDSIAVGSQQLRLSMNTLFQCMDQMNNDNLFIAATNMFHRIDNAFARRFDVKMEFEPPQEKIENVAERFMPHGMSLEADTNSEYMYLVNKQCIGNIDFSYYQLKKCVERAAKDSLIKGETTIKLSNIFNEVERSLGISIRK